MNQNQLQEKRRKRQAKRKGAQARARRRNEFERQQRDKGSVPYALPARASTPKPGFLGRLFGGTPVTGDQMDSEAAPIVGGGQ